jgi:hypothetical protein
VTLGTLGGKDNDDGTRTAGMYEKYVAPSMEAKVKTRTDTLLSQPDPKIEAKKSEIGQKYDEQKGAEKTAFDEEDNSQKQQTDQNIAKLQEQKDSERVKLEAEGAAETQQINQNITALQQQMETLAKQRAAKQASVLGPAGTGNMKDLDEIDARKAALDRQLMDAQQKADQLKIQRQKALLEKTSTIDKQIKDIQEKADLTKTQRLKLFNEKISVLDKKKNGELAEANEARVKAVADSVRRALGADIFGRNMVMNALSPGTEPAAEPAPAQTPPPAPPRTS